MSRQKNTKWTRLDNAAKIFPSTSSNRDTKVFRFACQLYDDIKPQILQHALDKTIEEFPSFLCILRRGLFWYYFEETYKRPVVTQENKPPCGILYHKNSKNLFFEVSYYKKRINFEVHHSLTDGTGALEFIKKLVFYYILENYSADFTQVPVYTLDASLFQKGDDSFAKYYSGNKNTKSKARIVRACRLSGLRYSAYRFRTLEGFLSTKNVIEAARRYECTLSVYLTAVLIDSIGKELSVLKRKRPVAISIPVNLRNYFQSGSVRNFFSLFTVSYNFSERSGDFLDILAITKESYQKGMEVERLKERLNLLASFEHNILTRVMPLFLKDIALKNINRFSNLEISASFSNMGVITMPKEMEPYIDLFSIFISPSKPQLCLCSYNGKLTIGFTSPFVNSEVEKHFFRTLVSQGAVVTLGATIPNED